VVGVGSVLGEQQGPAAASSGGGRRQQQQQAAAAAAAAVHIEEKHARKVRQEVRKGRIQG